MPGEWNPAVCCAVLGCAVPCRRCAELVCCHVVCCADSPGCSARHIALKASWADIHADWLVCSDAKYVCAHSSSVPRQAVKASRIACVTARACCRWDDSCLDVHQLTNLIDLRLKWVAVPAADLAGATQMQQLHLQGCTLLPSTSSSDAADGVGALLSTLERYQQLQHLELCELELQKTNGVAVQRFAALTASPELTYLNISGECGNPLLPAGALQHMFPGASRQLKLRRLVLLPTAQERHFHHQLDSEACCMTPAELCSTIDSCPELQRLCITGVVHPGDMSGLLQLPLCCTRLDIGGPSMTDAVASVLRQLTQLQYLSWWDSPGLTDVGAEQLTALTGLQDLNIGNCAGLSEELGGKPFQPEGFPPSEDRYLQLNAFHGDDGRWHVRVMGSTTAGFVNA